jgi:hypothetical protein
MKNGKIVMQSPAAPVGATAAAGHEEKLTTLKTGTDHLPDLAFNTEGIKNLNLLGKKADRLVISGDTRVNMQPGLLAMHTIWTREHNRVVDSLLKENPAMTDRDLFLRARKSTIATFQAITMYEWLPTVIGTGISRKYNLHSYTRGGGYTPDTIDARVSNAFATVATDDVFGFGHSQIADVLHRYEADLTSSKHGHLNLRDNYFSPGRVLRQGGIDPMLRGMILTACQKVDTKAADSVRNFLFGTNTKGFDLVAINIQRGRDHGIPDYNTLREGIGLKRMNSFEDITPDREIVSLLTRIYKGNVDNIDAYVGGLAEPHVAGGAVGELFANIIADQFARLRNGDRHWFENKAVSAGDPDEIIKYKRTTMAQVIARNSGLGEQDRIWDGHAGGASLAGAKGFFVPLGLRGREREESMEL